MFLFVFVDGGWDPTFVFADLLDVDGVDTEADARVETSGSLSWVGTEARTATRAFFESWGDRCCILNGLEVRSITHEACRRIVLTGGSEAAADDWPAILAGTASGWTLPDLVLSGPAFTSRYSSSVVRIGPDGQLGKLLSGEVFGDSDVTLRGPGDAVQALTDTLMRQRLDAFEATAGAGRPVRVAGDLQRALDQLEMMRSLEGGLELGLDSTSLVSVADRVVPALDCLELGLSRCAVVEHRGQFDVGWDSHADIGQQSDHYEVLFDDLDAILAELAVRTGPGGGALLDEVTVVVLSEMGRAPILNSRGGKDHWTFTSALLVGSGVAGGQVVGGFDDRLLGVPIDLETGAPSDDGVALTSANLGATLLALGGVDPEGHLPGVDPIVACLS